MGMQTRIVVYAPNQAKAEEACGAAFARIAELDSILSDYREDSELMRLCARSGTGTVRVSTDLFRVLQRSQEIAEATNGAFDVTAGPVIRVWRQARRTGKLPSVTAINNARSRTGWQSMTLDMHRRTVRLTKPGMQLDLGGIAKGYACDEARRVLERHGIRSALIEMGGDLVLSGAPPGRSGWTVEVPNAGTANGSATMTLRDCAVSSSGDTEQFAVIGGRRYSHVVDPRTGHASTNRVQATVIARDGFTSDPLSTAMTLLGQREREALLGRYQGSRAYVRRLEGMGE